MVVNSWRLDLLLGARMLAKYPALTLVGGFGIAVAVAIAAAGFSVIYGNFLASSLPLHEGHRLVSIELWDPSANRPERRVRHDFPVWRNELRLIHDVSAFRTLTPNLIAPGAQPVSVRVAAITAAGFSAARERPLLGRYLLEADEAEGAPTVLVIGEQVWRNRFAGDRAILGRTVQLGAVPHTIVGVMPAGFAFPVNHQFWVPLRHGPTPAAAREGPELMVFGRLAPGAAREAAQAEMETVSRRAWQPSASAYAQLRAQVMPYSHPFLGLHSTEDISGLHIMQALVNSLLVVVCLNIAILVYARTAMRQPEIALRTALGAGRGRIVGQLFLEALVLCLAAALVGVGIAAAALRYARSVVPESGELPYWLSFELSPGAVLYAGLLSLAAAAIIGIVPALRVTGRNLRGGLTLGKSWTVMVVAQVAVAVALLPSGLFYAWGAIRSGIAHPEFPAAEYLTAEVGLEAADDRRVSSRYEELRRRLLAEPNVRGVALAAALPGDEPGSLIETDREAAFRRVRVNRVDIEFFRLFEVRLLAGRLLRLEDQGGEAIVVNRALAQALFAGNALGRRLRPANNNSNASWQKIVGIVADFPPGVSKGMDDSPLRVYHAAAPEQFRPAALAIRLRGTTASGFAPVLREMAAAVDPELHVNNVFNLEEALRRDQWIRRLEAAVLLSTSLSVLLLAGAGIYAMMSLTITQRRKEIGIRMALGADGRRVVTGVFARALMQLAVGALLGLAAGAAMESASNGELLRGNGVVVLPSVALFMIAVGCVAGVGPVRRGLRIQPTEALRES